MAVTAAHHSLPPFQRGAFTGLIALFLLLTTSSGTLPPLRTNLITYVDTYRMLFAGTQDRMTLTPPPKYAKL
jgi:hypothetical protein